MHAWEAILRCILLLSKGTVVQWLEHHPVTVEVAGSSPVSLEFLLKTSN
jgi:hypothetical protein